MKLFILASMLLSLSSTVSLAQTEESNTFYSNNAIAAQELPKVRGLVRRVDLANSRITLKHEEIPNLGMPGMTMPFSVAEPQMLNGLSSGDRVLFTADMVNNELTVMWIEKQP